MPITMISTVPQTTNAPEDHRTTPNQPSKILIVDDISHSRETLRAMLAQEGYDLAFADDGYSALHQAAELLPDLILLDVMMPGMDGFEVCRRLRATPNLAEVPVILVTALDDRESRLRGIEAGADDFISKPIDRVELRARVRSITRLNRYQNLLVERLQRQQAQHDIEQRNRELDTLQEAHRLNTQFVSDVAHELRTPLLIMALTSDNLATLYDQLDDNKRKKLIAQMQKQTTMLSTLVTNVLDIARIDSQRNVSDRQRVDLSVLLREEAERQLPLATQQGHVLDVQAQEHLAVLGDAGQLSQILCNLLHNAIKYTLPGGQITCVCDRFVALVPTVLDSHAEQMLPAGVWARVQVSDTGIGIPQTAQSFIFERFYRVNTQGRSSGTGLGLAIVKELVHLHEGYIGVSSVLEVGSTFTVYVPLCEEADSHDSADFSGG